MYIYITINFTFPNKPIYANIFGTGPSTCPIPASPPDAGRDDSMASLVLCKKLAPLCLKCSDSKSCDFPSVNVLSFPMLKKGPYPIGIFFLVIFPKQVLEALVPGLFGTYSSSLPELPPTDKPHWG